MRCTPQCANLLGLLLLLCTIGSAQVRFLDTDLTEVRKLAGRQGRLYLAVFTADWCMPCHWMDEYTFQDAQLAEYANRHYLAVKVDIDQSIGQAPQARFSVTRLPTLIIFNTQGQIVAKAETSVAADDLLELLKEHNIAANRVIYQAFAQTPVMDSPKPKLRVYRPPLPAEYTADVPPPPVDIPTRQEAQVNTVPGSSAPSRVPIYRSSNDVVAPRSHRLYSVEVGVFQEYEEALRQVGQYESSFKQPVQLLARPQSDGTATYHLFIGRFSDLESAREMLSYLHRKNYSGVVKDLLAFKSSQK